MVRFFVIVCAMLGVAFLLPQVYPAATKIAFMAGTFGITWNLLSSAGMGFLAYKATK